MHRGNVVFVNILVQGWVIGKWVFIIVLLKQKKKGKFSDHHNKVDFYSS